MTLSLCDLEGIKNGRDDFTIRLREEDRDLALEKIRWLYSQETPQP